MTADGVYMTAAHREAIVRLDATQNAVRNLVDFGGTLHDQIVLLERLKSVLNAANAYNTDLILAVSRERDRLKRRGESLCEKARL